MLELTYKGIADRQAWESKGIELPKFDVEKVRENTLKNPTWVHIGSGNIFRAYIGNLQQHLLNEGLADTGILATTTFDPEIVDKACKPYDSLTVLVSLKADGSTDKKVIASISETVKAEMGTEDYKVLEDAFTNESLQMVSFTITEKGYSLYNMAGELLPFVVADMEKGPKEACTHAMSIVTALLYKRYEAGKLPVSLVSMDNCSHNGDKVKSSVLTIAKAWLEKGFVEEGFIAYLEDESKVAFPWSMIDKITPRPSEFVQKQLEELGIKDMAPIVTSNNTFIAPFVNAEVPEYLVIEDKFPNGRPCLEKAGVYFTDRDTVNNVERMKVTTCLNPLHTALAVYGCLLGYTSIAEEMKDKELKSLVEKIGYQEGMPVVVDPKILSPKAFIDEVINLRLPNPFIPDAPQRIATDTSMKLAIRFGETIKSYVAREDLDPTTLVYIPLVLAGWCRYLLAKDDNLEDMSVSSDPMLAELQATLSTVKADDVASYNGQLKDILSNPVLFGVNLYEVGLAEKVEGMFKEMLAGKGAVRNTLVKYLNN